MNRKTKRRKRKKGDQRIQNEQKQKNCRKTRNGLELKDKNDYYFLTMEREVQNRTTESKMNSNRRIVERPEMDQN